MRLTSIPFPIPVEEAEQEAAAPLTGGSRFLDQPPLRSEDYQRLQARLHERRSGSTSCVGPATSDGRAKLEPKRRHRLESRVGGKVEDPGASFVKADPVPESTPDSALDSTLPKGWEVWWKSR